MYDRLGFFLFSKFPSTDLFNVQGSFMNVSLTYVVFTFISIFAKNMTTLLTSLIGFKDKKRIAESIEPIVLAKFMAKI